MRDAAHPSAKLAVPSVFELLSKELLDRVGLSEWDRVLDVACGSGVVGREAIRRGTGYVAGIDVDPARIRPGRRRMACGARAEALPFSDGTFSLVTCQHGLMFFADRSTALREAARVLRTEGRFGATCWCSLEQNPGFLALHRAIEEELGRDAAERARRPFSLPDARVVAREAAAAGFSRVEPETLDVPIVGRSIDEISDWYLFGTSIAPFAEGRPEAVPRIRARVAEELAPYLEPSGVVLPAKAYCVTASPG